jgi:uncharacterized protein (TIGR02246 family)
MDGGVGRRAVMGGVALAGAMGSSAMARATVSVEERTAIEAVVRGYVDSWNAHDMDAMFRLFTPEASWVNVVGMYWRGRDEVRQAHAAFHATIFKTNTLELRTIDTRRLTPDVALTVSEILQGAYRTPDGHEQPETPDRISLTLSRQPSGGWLITHGHNTIVNLQAAKNDPVNAAR